MTESKPVRATSRRRTREPLTRERILQAAIDIIDRDGFPAFSMRKLGRALGVEAMSLYEYFESKEDILLAIRSHFYGQLDLPVPAETPWFEELRMVLLATYQMGVAHPSFVAVHLHVPRVPESRRRAERDVALLRGAGFSADEASGAMVALVSYTMGYLFRMVLTTPAANPLAHKSRDSGYELGLDAILRGLKAQAESKTREADAPGPAARVGRV